MTKLRTNFYFSCLFILFSFLVSVGYSIRCFQCSSDEDPRIEGKVLQDNCGAYKKFDQNQHIAVECNSEESHMPGTFCMKQTRQGPRGFIWDGRWRQVIRKCASVADTGVTGVCNWGVFENGVYWEECYCSEDECNGASHLNKKNFVLVGVLVSLYYYFIL